jgi:hypothetical protein
MRSLFLAATIVALLLSACNGAQESGTGTGPQDSPIQTPEQAQSSPTDAPQTPQSSENALVETAEYTGVIISENGAAEFSYLFDQDSTSFWEPTADDVSKAEACIRQYLLSLEDNPELDTYQKENIAFILENLKEYRRQYVGIEVDGEKRIWCNAFLGDFSFLNWEHVPVDVDDGGNRFWQIEYDLLKDECVNFYVHGEA